MPANKHKNFDLDLATASLPTPMASRKVLYDMLHMHDWYRKAKDPSLLEHARREMRTFLVEHWELHKPAMMKSQGVKNESPDATGAKRKSAAESGAGSAASGSSEQPTLKAR